jgi:hypothetical protein
MELKAHLAALACLGLVAGGASLGQIDGFNLASAAQAKGGGNGGGNGGGHGNGGNGGSSHGQSSSNHGKSAEAHGKSVSHETTAAVSDVDSDANSLGALNAAHASATAREHASPNSAVGKIAAYEKSREAASALEDPDAQEQALADAEAQLAADFNLAELTSDQFSQINALLDARQ